MRDVVKFGAICVALGLMLPMPSTFPHVELFSGINGTSSETK